MITSITDVKNALHAAPAHETLVQIADFGSKHLQEMQNLRPEEKQALFSRLVTENYSSQELENVIAVADQFFKEDASALSPTARLHLFRYMEQKHLEQAGYLLKLPKGEREIEVYRALLTPLLKQEAAITSCIVALRKLPEKQREERLAQLKMCLEAFPSIDKGFGSLLINAYSGLSDKLVFLKKRGVVFTDGDRLNYTVKRPLEEIAPLGVFPLLSLKDIYDTTHDWEFDEVNQLVNEMPALSQCSSLEEYKEIRAIALWNKMGLCERFNRFAEAFPKIKQWGYLLAPLNELSDGQAEKVLTFMRGKEPFSDLTSGAMLGFFINKVAEGKEDFPFKQFSAAFPGLMKNFGDVGQRIGRVFDSVQKFGLDKLPITDGKILCIVLELKEPQLQLFVDCVKAFPLINSYEDLARGIESLKPEQIKTLELLMSAAIPFSRVNELMGMIPVLDSESGGKEGWLLAFNRDVVSRFPAINRDFRELWIHYRGIPSEVWQYLENKELISKEQKGRRLTSFATAFQLSNFKSSAERDKFWQLYCRFVAAFSEIDFGGYLPSLSRNDLLQLILNNFPDAPLCFHSENSLISFISYLEGIEENKRAGLLALLQKHFEISANNQLESDYRLLLSIPAEEQEHVLTLLGKIDYIEMVQNYPLVVKRLSYLDRSEREALITALSSFNDSGQKALFLEHLLSFPKNMHALILQNINTSQLPLTKDQLVTISLIPNDIVVEENREAISAHLIYLLENNSDNPEMLRNLLKEVKALAAKLSLGDEESPLERAIVQYEVLLSDKRDVTPWSIYQKHKERLYSAEKLPYPAFDNGYFNYEALRAVVAITPDTLPKGINLAKLKALTAAFVERYDKLDEGRKDAISNYLKTVLPAFVSIENLVKTIDDPWWDYHLRATPPISETTWKLFNAVAYVAKESDKAGTTLPGAEDTPANFQLREKLLSPQEGALLKLLGQVQNCNIGKDWGLEVFSQLMPSTLPPKKGNAQERISEAVRGYLQQMIYTNAFLNKVLGGESTGGQPLHYAKYICNALSKELGFPLRFDPGTESIATDSVLHKKTAQELLTAVFVEVRPNDFHKFILVSLNGLDWSSQEGVDLFINLKLRAPPQELKECCLFDEDEMLTGITLKAVPYLLKQYGFFSGEPR